MEVHGVKRWQIVIIACLVMLSGWITPDMSCAERARPVRIGALTESWGPTPAMVGMRDALQKLGYREREDFVLGVRSTQGKLAALPAAAQQLVQYGVDLIFTVGVNATKAAQGAIQNSMNVTTVTSSRSAFAIIWTP